ncbi:MAG TPA: GvpL/GvpF family gas vesicle protein [Solirubrobacteraceae bacterium]|nr:GvpL/GvpF family gas vesicle protein [Solirubrobacteraceae bacterium]
MPSGDDPLEHLRSAIDQLAAFDVDGLVVEARAEARARVRATLVELMEHAMLEQVQQEFAPPRRAQQSSRAQPPPADPDPHTGPAWYVYGVINAADQPEEPLPGVDASRLVQILTEGAVAAAVSEVELGEFGETQLREHLRDMNWVERVARAHETVLDRIRAQATVVPMRMCTVYRTEAGVREMLRREADALCQAIDHLRGKAEWGVKAFADAGRMAAVTASQDEDAVDDARGAAYMRRRRDERDRREHARQQLEQVAAEIHDRLCTLAGDGHVLPPQRPEVSGHAGDMVLNGVYLVGDDDRERFHAEVQLLEAEFAPLGVELELTGPWPAYNFVPGTIGAAW